MLKHREDVTSSQADAGKGLQRLGMIRQEGQIGPGYQNKVVDQLPGMRKEELLFFSMVPEFKLRYRYS